MNDTGNEPTGAAGGEPRPDDELPPAESVRGPVAWFARNSVAANIIMIVLLFGGCLKLGSIKQEVFPEFELDIVVINVPYLGASPREVEQGVLMATEEAVRAVDGVKRIRSTAYEGMGVIIVELLLGTDADQALNDIKSAVDRVPSFPENVERPTTFLVNNRMQVISLVYYGDASEKALRELAENARDDLLRDDRITVVELAGVRPLEVSIEVSQADLLDNNLTLDRVAGLVRASSIEVPGGGVKTDRGEVLIRTDERRDSGSEFEDVILLSNAQGTVVRVGDIADVKDGFAETDVAAEFNGKRAVMVNVYRVADQTPIEVSDAVKEYIEREREALPPGVDMATWFDTSEFYADRIDLLVRNAWLGLILVMIVLGLFLEIRLAFWVTLGIPISFIGSLLLLPATGVSINMISLFAFIIVLGMVVDDAIIVGESVYKRRQSGMSFLNAAIYGAREVATPVVFAIITTMLAYAPMLFVPGPAGKFFRVIPIVVICVLLMSLIESLLILPAHLAHSKRDGDRGIFGWIHRQQQRFGDALERHIDRFYKPLVRQAARRRYLTIALCFAIFIATVGLVAGGRVKNTFLPKVDSDVVTAAAELPFGSSIERTREVNARMLAEARALLEEYGGEDAISRGIFSQTGQSTMVGLGSPGGAQSSTGSHLTEVSVFMVPSDQRPMTAREFATRWRASLRDIPGIERVSFVFETGPSAGEAINIELSHEDMDTLNAAARDLAGRLSEYTGTYEIDDGFSEGKEQLNLRIKPAAKSLGLTEAELARQVRAAFFGAEAVRQQRGRDEVRVYVRLPRAERESEYNIEEMILRTPSGGEVMLRDAADISRGRSYMSIRRIDGRQAVAVTSNVDEASGNAVEIMARVQSEALPEVMSRYPGLAYSIGGEGKERAEMQDSLKAGFLLALLAMFALLAIAFKSYVQPIIILTAIPFGFVGAIIGHVIMGYSLSMMSMMGVVALSGVVVNDSLILIVAINRFRDEGMSLIDAVVAGGVRRFRPILLTSLTTFFGVLPMILETSVQARFLIPMALSLGFGVLFATFITLLLVPAVYVAINDARRGVGRVRGGYRALTGSDVEPSSAPPPTAVRDPDPQ